MKATGESRESPLLSLPFDHYERYLLTQRLAGQLWGDRASREVLRILDVGGHLSSLKHFLPDDFVVLTDPQTPPPFTYSENVSFDCDEYVRGIGGRLPFADEAFDLVTAHDTLEHVPEGGRPAFIADLLRVARRFIILNGPVRHPQTVQAEQRLARFWREALLWTEHALDQHLELGLPSADMIRQVLDEHRVSYVSIPNGNIVRWLGTMALKFYFVALPDSEPLQDIIYRTYNALISSSDFGGVCYRESFVIAKQQSDKDSLVSVDEAYRTLRESPGVSDDVGELDPLLDALTAHACRMRQILTDTGNLIRELQSTVAGQASAIADRDAHLNERASALAAREADIARLEAHLSAIQSSVGYRLLERSRGGARKAFPANSLRGFPYRALRRLLNRLLSPPEG